MAQRRLIFTLVILSIAAALAWWAVTTQRFAPLLGPSMRLMPASFADLPGWSTNDPRDAITAFARSCQALVKKQPTASMGGAGYAGTVDDWLPACRAVPSSNVSAQAARKFFEDWAVPVAVSAGGDASGIFTGYYEPELRASRTQHGAYQTPIYATPENLVSVDVGDFLDDLAGRRFTACVDGHKLVRCPERGIIDSSGLKQSKILFYADDPVSVFFLHIQGSGRVQLDDGTMARLAYDSQNGQPYTAIGKTLIDMGVPRDGMSMQVIRQWLKDHPGDARRVMETDKSFVFFKAEPVGDPKEGAEGSEGVPLTAGASLAVDTRLHALGAPIFVAAKRPDADPSRDEHDFNQLLVAQDTGGAIKGPVRGDVFWGFGADAESVAGRMKSSGKLYVLLPKPVAQRLGTGQDFRVP